MGMIHDRRGDFIEQSCGGDGNRRTGRGRSKAHESARTGLRDVGDGARGAGRSVGHDDVDFVVFGVEVFFHGVLAGVRAGRGYITKPPPARKARSFCLLRARLRPILR